MTFLGIIQKNECKFLVSVRENCLFFRSWNVLPLCAQRCQPPTEHNLGLCASAELNPHPSHWAVGVWQLLKRCIVNLDTGSGSRKGGAELKKHRFPLLRRNRHSPSCHGLVESVPAGGRELERDDLQGPFWPKPVRDSAMIKHQTTNTKPLPPKPNYPTSTPLQGLD